MLLILLFLSSLASAEVTELTACESITRNLLCVTDAIPWDGKLSDVEYSKLNQARTCRAGKDDLKNYVMEVYKTTPPEVQRAICNLKIIYIEETSNPYGASVQQHYDFNDVINERVENGVRKFDIKVVGSSMNINAPARIGRRETCGQMHDRWLRGYFGLKKNDPAMPHFAFPADEEKCSFRTTLIHEAGHVLDFAAGYVSEQPMWFEQSFTQVLVTGKPPQYIPLFDPQLLQAMHSHSLPLSEAPHLFAEFDKSPFISFYAMAGEMEDFADEFMGALGVYPFQVLDSAGKVLIDSEARTQTEPVRMLKRAYLKNFIANSALRYEMQPHYETRDDSSMPFAIKFASSFPAF